ncbi:plasmid mobilization relaxosome protein MobC [uncultured Campylobacter sp.]|uniref:plasmid mobilization protein n=1 Tax=uncultured Campylobacter sp. TaxID=218934 RepID=UPI00261CAFA4|nr:plasmid mobilization relaxosome protein MobC [uncultured Campylobacter sp.]
MRNGISIFLNEKEKKLLKAKSTELGLTQSSYIRELINNIDYIKERKALNSFISLNQDLLKELNKIGININQIAFSLNTGIKQDSKSIKDEIKELKHLLKSFNDFYTENLGVKIIKRKGFRK